MTYLKKYEEVAHVLRHSLQYVVESPQGIPSNHQGFPDPVGYFIEYEIRDMTARLA